MLNSTSNLQASKHKGPLCRGACLLRQQLLASTLLSSFVVPKLAGAVAPPFEAASELKQSMPPEQQQWLADVEAMQAAFRWVHSEGALWPPAMHMVHMSAPMHHNITEWTSAHH